ncbi:MAG: hypothetical protein K1X79_09215, partial [Oligoflexia bacterium]|nr:hypothetical protein [Oligoflexia bacterium]
PAMPRKSRFASLKGAIAIENGFIIAAISLLSYFAIRSLVIAILGSLCGATGAVNGVKVNGQLSKFISNSSTAICRVGVQINATSTNWVTVWNKTF